MDFGVSVTVVAIVVAIVFSAIFSSRKRRFRVGVRTERCERGEKKTLRSVVFCDFRSCFSVSAAVATVVAVAVGKRSKGPEKIRV